MSLFDEKVERKNTYSYKYDEMIPEFGEDDLLPLWVADMDFKVADVIQEAIIQRAEHGVYGYVGGIDSTYYSSIQKWFKNRHSLDIDEKHIVLTDTIISGIIRLVRLYSNPGDKIIVQSPVYSQFHHLIRNNNRIIVENHLIKTNSGYVMDYENLEKIIDKKTKLLILCNPHNPVGRVWTKNELKRLYKICSDNNILIISDEAHADIIYEGNRFTSLLEIGEGVICTSPHKTFNIAGLKIANFIIPNDNIRENYIKAMNKDGVFYTNPFALVASIASYEKGDIWLDCLLKYLENNIAYLNENIKKYLPKVKWYIPQGTYLAWLDFSEYNLSQEELYSKVYKEAKVALSPGEEFDKASTQCFRLNFACSKETLEIFMDRMSKVF